MLVIFADRNQCSSAGERRENCVCTDTDSSNQRRCKMAPSRRPGGTETGAQNGAVMENSTQSTRTSFAILSSISPPWN